MEKEFETKKSFCKSKILLLLIFFTNLASRDWMTKNDQEKPQTFQVR